MLNFISPEEFLGFSFSMHPSESSFASHIKLPEEVSLFLHTSLACSEGRVGKSSNSLQVLAFVEQTLLL